MIEGNGGLRPRRSTHEPPCAPSFARGVGLHGNTRGLPRVPAGSAVARPEKEGSMPKKWTRLFMGFGFVTTAAMGRDASAAECLTSSGKTACGFHCVASDGQVRCAQTPEGICSTASGVVACWDPPAVLRRVFGDR